MKDALPSEPPRWYPVAALIVVILLTQFLVNRGPAVFGAIDAYGLYGFPHGEGPSLPAALNNVGSLNVTSISSLFATLAEAYPSQLLYLFSALGVATYVVFRLPAAGFALARMVVNAPRALTWRNRGSALAYYARTRDVNGREAEVLNQLGLAQASDVPWDLFVKAAVLAGPLFYGVFALRAVLEVGGGFFLSRALVVLIPTGVRLGWLVVASVRRASRGGSAVLLIGIALVMIPAAVQHVPSAGVVRRQLEATTNATDHDRLQGLFDTAIELKGIDLRGRDLQGLFLGYADLTDADLADADLARSSLVQATLVNASLEGADLAEADLVAADLRSADLRDTNLEGACYDAHTKWPHGGPPRNVGLRRLHVGQDNNPCRYPS